MEKLLTQFHDAAKAGLQNIAAALDEFSRGVAAEIERARPRAIAARDDDPGLPLDVALFDSAPTVAVPKHAKFAALEGVGHRFLMAAEGVFVEVKRPWLHLIQPLGAPFASDTRPRPPYGNVEPKIEYTFGRLGVALPLLQQFADAARAALPNEHAAWVIWNQGTQALEYRELKTTNASPGSVTFERPALAEHESLAIDLHSHGDGPAFFSHEDNVDDAGEVKISGVLGGLGGAPGSAPGAVFRLCALGLYLPLKVPVEAIFQLSRAV